MDAEVTAEPSASAVAGPSEEARRKRLTGESATVAPTSSVTESPTSRPPFGQACCCSSTTNEECINR